LKSGTLLADNADNYLLSHYCATKTTQLRLPLLGSSPHQKTPDQPVLKVAATPETMSFQYISVEEAIKRGGLRMVVVGGVPSPWGEAAKGFLHINIARQSG
jgi:hypothetical protein